jgi:hypothetical protein
VADARATIKINVTTDKKDFASAIAQMNGLNSALGNGSTNSNKFTQSLNKTTTSFKSYSGGAIGAARATRGFNNQTMTSQKLIGVLNKSMRAIFWIVIALGIEFAITATTLASVNAAFTLGRMAVKAYHVSLGLLAGALASVTAAIGVGLATFQEYTAAMTAFSYKGVTDLGDGMEQSSSAMRNFAKDTSLATVGVVALTQAYSAMAKQAPVSAAQRKALAGALDFTTTAEDPKKAFQSLSQFIGLVTKAKKVDSKATTAAQSVSPEFAKAVAGQKDKSAGAILAALSSGQLAGAAGVSGNYKMQQTLVGQFQSFLADLVVQLTDFGRKLLEPAKDVLESYYKNFRNTFRRTEGIISGFAKGTMFPGLITIGNSLEEFSVKLLRDYLPKISGGADWLRKTFSDLKASFAQFVNSLDKFRAGSKIITDTFGEPLLALFKGFGRNAEQLGYLAEDNEEAFLKWGKALEGLVFSIFDFFAAMKVAFTEALPVLTQIVNGLASLVRGLSAVISLTGTLGGGGGNSGTVGAGMGPVLSSAITMGLMYAGYKGRRRFGRGGGIGTKTGPSTASKYGYQQAAMGAPLMQRMFGSPNLMGSGGFLQRTGSAFGRGSFGARASRGFTATLGGNSTSVSNQAAMLATQMYRDQTGRLGLSGFAKAKIGDFDPFTGKTITTARDLADAQKARRSLGALSYRDLAKAARTGRPDDLSTPASGRGFKEGTVGRVNPLTGATMNARQAAMFGIRTKVGGAMTGRVEGMQAGLRGSFTPGLGMAGSLITASGVTSRIGNETARSAVDMGLAGSYFGKRGAIVGAGLGVMSKTTNYAAGAIAGGATGAQIAGTLTAGLPPQAQAIGKALGFAIGTAVGIFTIRARRSKTAKGIADQMVQQTGARSIEALLNSPTLSTLGATEQIAKDKKIYDRAIEMSKAGSGDQAVRDYLLSTGTINKEQAKAIDMSDGAFIKQLESNSAALKMQGESYVKFENNVNALTLSTGKSREEIFKLAKETGVNLFDASKNLTQNFSDLGLSMRKTAQDIKNSMQDIRTSALSELDQMRARRESFEALRSSQKDLTELGAGATQDDFANYQKTMSDYVSMAFPDDPAKQMDVFRSFATGSMFSDPTSPFFGNTGLKDAFYRTQNIGGFLVSAQSGAQAAATNAYKGYSSKIATPGISGLLNMGGAQFARGDIAGNVLNERIASAISAGTFNQTGFESFLKEGDMSNINNASEIMALLESYGVKFEGNDKMALQTQNNLEAAILSGSLDKVATELHQQFLQAIETGFDASPEWWETQPQWWRDMLNAGLVGPTGTTPDTSSPRRGMIGDTSTSRTLGRTLSAHSRFDSALTGSRKITSAFRTFGLGSPSSDHAAGRAYDLTGQNLGQYAKMISDSGGFAEFHGSASSRHLHVVPPLGDTSVSRVTSGKGTSSGGGVAVAPVTVNVYGTQNQSPQEIAKQVIYEIEKAQRNFRERY